MKWHNLGLVTFEHILKDSSLISWDALSTTFNLPISQARTYNILKNALDPILSSSSPPTLSPISSLCWVDSSPFPLMKEKLVYYSLANFEDILTHFNNVWNLTWDSKKWHSALLRFWSAPTEPKRSSLPGNFCFTSFLLKTIMATPYHVNCVVSLNLCYIFFFSVISPKRCVNCLVFQLILNVLLLMRWYLVILKVARNVLISFGTMVQHMSSSVSCHMALPGTE